LAGLGFKEDSPGWYGGKVQFSGRLKDTSSTKTPNYTVLLDRPVLGPSCRFGRRFGSPNILKIKLPKPILNKSDNGLLEFFMRPFIIHNHVFRTFYAKDNNMFLFRTNEVMSDSGITAPGSSATGGPMSLMEFLNWHNPLEFNSKQVFDWIYRFV
jgi:RNA-dependent RNA polymerase